MVSRSVLLSIEVADQDVGISPEQQARLFHAFTQADGTMNRKYGGTGLGLIISKRIALLMGGDAGVGSAEGQGSTFWATLRLRRAQEPVMNGLEANRAIRLLPGMAAVPILALTANAFDEDRDACLAAGMDDHIGKPVAADVLCTIVLHWLQKSAGSTPS